MLGFQQDTIIILMQSCVPLNEQTLYALSVPMDVIYEVQNKRQSNTYQYRLQ
jgi:hypothetical protein